MAGKQVFALLAAVAGVFASSAALAQRPPPPPPVDHGSTWYVRVDGGSAAQCTGRSNRPYPGSGSGQACAWSGLHVALPTTDQPRIAGGDTVYVAPGSYRTGWGGPGVTQSARCSAASPSGCYLAAIPSGPSAGRPTRLLGSGPAIGKCVDPPQLWGSERVETVLNLEGSSNVQVGCLEITDRSDCIEFHADAATRCPRSTAPYGNWASTGVSARASGNVVLRDVDVHGLANTGVRAGNLSDWSLTRVRIVANGWAGWDGDIGADSANTGYLDFREVEIAWNGCGERWQTGAIHGCWAQQAGGYGDGLGTATTGGHWLFQDSFIHHNTSDGLDLLYLDGSAGASVVVRRVVAQGNAGNAIKTYGRALVENSVVVGDCAYFEGRDFMTAGDQCRAQGNALSVGLSAGQPVVVRHNTVTGEGDCLLLSTGGNAASSLSVVNNAWLGGADWTGAPGERSCGHYAQSQPAPTSYAGNLYWQVKNGFCPGGSVCGEDPVLADPDMATFDPMPLPASALLDRVAHLPAAGRDFYLKPRPNGSAADIGAVERQGQPGAPPGRPGTR